METRAMSTSRVKKIAGSSSCAVRPGAAWSTLGLASSIESISVAEIPSSDLCPACYEAPLLLCARNRMICVCWGCVIGLLIVALLVIVIVGTQLDVI